jgi:Holliday junction resolvase-like predicted endonuclease
MQGRSAVLGFQEAREKYFKGDYLGMVFAGAGGLMSGLSAVGGLRHARQLFGRDGHCQPRRVFPWHKDQSSCFRAGVPIKLRDGRSRRIEEFVEGDTLLTRDEHDPFGELRTGVVVAVFTRVARIDNVHVGGGYIETTAEHPFYVRYKGWVEAAYLRAGDELSSSDGCWVRCEGVADSGQVDTVYNLTVSGDHTYFVGEDIWGFDVWAHNQCSGKSLGDFGEAKVKALLQAKGLKFVGQIQNASGHGIDLVFRTKSGKLVFVEVKSSSGSIAPGLSKAQSNAASFVSDRLDKAATAGNNKGRWKNVNQSTKSLAASIQDDIANGVGAVFLKANVTNMFTGHNASILSFSVWK